VLGWHRASTVERRSTIVKAELLPLARVESVILVVRRHRVILDADLAELYGVQTKALSQAVRRNPRRFPADFMFRLTREEARILRSQIVTSRSEVIDMRRVSSSGGRMPPAGVRSQAASPTSWGGRRHLPYAFTEQGVAMLSSVLRCPRAIQVNVEIMRAFVRLRQMLQADTDLAKKLDALEKKYDAQFRVVFDAIRELMAPPPGPERRIGFRSEDR